MSIPIRVVLFGLLAAACVQRQPLDNRSCPCSDGFVCCAKSHLCLPPQVECSCPSGTHEGGDGNCVRRGICSAGYHDGGDGTCVSAAECRAGYHDGGDGTCVANGTCSAQFHDGGDGTCLEAGACIAGLHDDGFGKCVASGCAQGCYVDSTGACKQLLGGLWKPVWSIHSSGSMYSGFCTDDGTKMGGEFGDGVSSDVRISRDSGATWTQASFSIGGISVGRGTFSTRFSAGGRHMATFVPYSNPDSKQSLFISQDWGETWTVIDHTWELPSTTWYFITMTDDGAKLMAYAARISKLFTSTDSGTTWYEQSGYYVPSTPVSSQGGHWVAHRSAADPAVIGVSSDWGETWGQRKAPCDYSDFGFIGPEGRLIVRCSGNIYASPDGGQTWSEDVGWSCAQLPLASVDGQVLACTDESRNLFVSRDAGKTWTRRASAGARLKGLSPDGSKAVGALYDESSGDLTAYFADLGQ